MQTEQKSQQSQQSQSEEHVLSRLFPALTKSIFTPASCGHAVDHAQYCRRVAPRNHMRVFVKWQSGGDAGTVDLQREDSVAAVRAKVADACRVHPTLQQLVFRGVMLDESDDKTVRDYGIEIDDDLRLSSLPPPRVVRLNVGGTRYTTLLSTLRTLPESRLAQMFDAPDHDFGEEGLAEGQAGSTSTILVPQDPAGDGAFFIDRHGPSFAHILTWLRDGTAAARPQQPAELRQLAAEARYFGLDELAERCELSTGACRVHSLASLVEECGGGTSAAEISALSDVEVTTLLEEMQVNVLFAKRIWSQIFAERERARREAVAEAARLAALGEVERNVELLRVGLEQLGAEPLSDDGLQTLGATGLTLRAACELDAAGARAHGLSEEDARRLGKPMVLPLEKIALCMEDEATAPKGGHGVGAWRGYSVSTRAAAAWADCGCRALEVRSKSGRLCSSRAGRSEQSGQPVGTQRRERGGMAHLLVRAASCSSGGRLGGR